MYQPDIFVNILIYQNDEHLLCTKSEAEYKRAYSQAIVDIGILENHLRKINVPYGIQYRASQVWQPNSYVTPGYHIIRADIDAIWEVSIVATRSDFQHFPDEDLLNNKILKSIPDSPHISFISLNQDLKVLACHYGVSLKAFKVSIWDKYAPLGAYLSRERVDLLKAYGDLMRVEFCQEFEPIAQECQGESDDDDNELLDPLWDEYPLIVVSYDDCPEKAVGRFAKQVAQTVCDIVSESWYPLNDFVPQVYCKDDRGFFEGVTPSRNVLECVNGFAFIQ